MKITTGFIRHGDVCSCAPKQFKEWVYLTESDRCSYCKEDIESDEDSLALNAMLMCVKDATRRHILQFVAHEACTEKLNTFMMEHNLQRKFTNLPEYPEKMEPACFNVYRYMCTVNNRLTGRTCASCGSAEQALSKMPTCSQCNTAAYCDEACQKKHWKRHRKKCKPGKGAEKEEEEEDLFEIGMYCSCFTDYEDMLYFRQHDVCSNPACNRKPVHPDHFAMHMKTCSNDYARIHSIATCYCSKKCKSKFK